MSKYHLDKRAADLIAAGAGNPDDLLTTRQVALWLSMSVITLEIWRSKGMGPPFIKLTPRMVRYQRGGVLNWLANRRCAPTLNQWCPKANPLPEHSLGNKLYREILAREFPGPPLAVS